MLKMSDSWDCHVASCFVASAVCVCVGGGACLRMRVHV